MTLIVYNVVSLFWCIISFLLLSYEENHWGWNDKQKREEMTDEKAWYLIARDANDESHPVALVHFRFDLEGEEEVLYW